MTDAPTTRLYYDDAYLLTFEAAVTAVRNSEGALLLALDRSAFYPTSGGQDHDLGVLTASDDSRTRIVDVQADDAGRVWHTVDASRPEPWAEGTRVQGVVDARRRADHRQQHSGQHVLSASCASVCHAETRSVHLGADVCTLDLDRELSDDEIAAVEEAANRVVLENRAVRVRYVDGAETAALPLRRPTTRSGRVRLVEIDGHDLSACGGTHVAQTGEIGAIVVRGTERFKGGARLTFLCGARAVASHRALAHALDAAGRTLSVSPADVPQAIAKLQEDGRELRRSLEAALSRIGEFEADALTRHFVRQGDAEVLVAHVEQADPTVLRRLATSLVALPGRAVVLLGAVSPHALVVARSADLNDFDAGAFARAVAQDAGGKAGGRPDFAQGGGLVGLDLEAVRARLHETLAGR